MWPWNKRKREADVAPALVGLLVLAALTVRAEKAADTEALNREAIEGAAA